MTTRSERRSGVKYISTPKGYIIVDENKPKEISPWAQLVKTPKRYVMAMLLLLTLLGEFNSSAFQGLGHLLLCRMLGGRLRFRIFFLPIKENSAFAAELLLD